MHDSKLIQSIKVLKKEEIEGVKELLYSDYLIKGSYKNECIRLFEYIMPYYPEFDSEALERNIVLEEIFKGENSKINRLEKTMSALLNIVDFYITHFLLDSNVIAPKSNTNLAIFYRERNYYGRSKNLLKKAEGYLLEQSKIDIDYYECLYLLKYEKLNIEDLIEKRFEGNAYLDLLNDIDEIAILKKINHVIRVAYKELGISNHIKLKMDELKKEINENGKLQNNILIKVLLLPYSLLEDCFNENFKNTYQIFLNTIELHRCNLSFDMIILLNAFEDLCLGLRHNHFPNLDNLSLIHKASKIRLRSVNLNYGLRIYNADVLNFVIRSQKLKDTDGLKEFIMEYEEIIGKFKENKDLVNLCWAVYFFMQKKYEKIDELLLQKYDNYYFQMFARRLRMKIYYETKEEVILTYEIDAHKVYVHRLYGRNEIDISHYEPNTNFCNRLKQIINLRHNPDEKNKERLYKKVEEQKCSDKEWLLEKIEEIKVPYSKQ